MEKVIYLLVLLSFFLTTSVAGPVIDNRILGGSDAKPGQFPSVVYLTTPLNIYLCGGCILNDRWVLTSGHCTMGHGQDAINVVAGSHRRSIGGLVFRSSRIFTHPDFNFDLMANDVSLILISTSFLWNNNIQTIDLGHSVVSGGLTAILVGWGLTTNPGLPSDVLQWLPTVTITQDECRSRHALAQRALIHANTLCTSNQFGHGMCMGDTGGPVIINNYVAGIKSWSVQCGLVPDIHARVSSHREWIVSLTEAPIHQLP